LTGPELCQRAKTVEVDFGSEELFGLAKFGVDPYLLWSKVEKRGLAEVDSMVDGLVFPGVVFRRALCGLRVWDNRDTALLLSVLVSRPILLVRLPSRWFYFCGQGKYTRKRAADLATLGCLSFFLSRIIVKFALP